MKKIIPAKYIVVISVVCLVFFPMALYLIPLTVFYLLTFGNSIIPYQVIFVGFFFGVIIEIMFLYSPEYCKLIITNETITNFIPDGTHNEGWCENISNIRKIELVGKEEVQKYYKQFNKSKAILIDFGNCNIKYIYVGEFSKRQIKKTMDLLSNK